MSAARAALAALAVLAMGAPSLSDHTGGRNG